MPAGGAALINAGSRAIADIINTLTPYYAYKAADQSVTSSTTLVNDNDLWAPITANYGYELEVFIDYEGGTLGSSDIQWQWAVPTGTTVRYAWTGYALAGGWGGGLQLGSDVVNASTVASGNTLRPLMMRGTIFTGSTGGTIQWKWSQNTSNATATKVHAQSALKITRMF